MFSLFSIFAVICLYMALLFAVATAAERQQSLLQRHYLWIYALSLGVFHTSWGFYGNVGYAASHGFMFAMLDLGSYLCIALWWWLLHRMVVIKEALHITSLADMLAVRYNRSQLLAAIATLIIVLGSVPYIGLQIKAVIQSVSILTATPVDSENLTLTGIISSLILLLFTIFYGIRKLDPTEHHYGMLTVLAVECLIKILAILAVGVFVTYGLFNGIGDIFNQLEQRGLSHITGLGPTEQRISATVGLFVIGFFSVLMLPRQFHIAVVENSSKRHIKPASVILGIYLLLFSVFIVPIAGAGVLQGIDPSQADMTMLLLPMQNNQGWLAMITFIGGFAAASGMVIITTTTVSTMVANHLLLPLAEQWPQLSWMRSYLLQVRWAVALIVIMLGYLFVTALTASYLLLSIGTLAITALLQVVPALFGGLFWNRGNRQAALWGMVVGMLFWFYTLLLPILLRQYNADNGILSDGLYGVSWLRPDALLGLDGMDSTAHGLLFSLGLNTLLYLVISLLTRPTEEEQKLTLEFMELFSRGSERKIRPSGLDDHIPLESKRQEALQLLSHYLKRNKAQEILQQIETSLHIGDKTSINVIELVEYHRMLEHELAGSIGSTSAHSAIKSQLCYSKQEADELQAVFQHISTELKGSFTERRKSGKQLHLLQARIEDLERTVSEQQIEIEQLMDRLDQRYEEIHQYRIQSQQYKDTLRQMKAKLAGRDVADLEQENKRLKMLYAELSLEADRLRKEQQ